MNQSQGFHAGSILLMFLTLAASEIRVDTWEDPSSNSAKLWRRVQIEVTASVTSEMTVSLSTSAVLTRLFDRVSSCFFCHAMNWSLSMAWMMLGRPWCTCTKHLQQWTIRIHDFKLVFIYFRVLFPHIRHFHSQSGQINTSAIVWSWVLSLLKRLPLANLWASVAKIAQYKQCRIYSVSYMYD
jgi:hypothetical protein